ncbi:MAG: hypothetical protein JNK60_01870 [Acidobacteria bacterium]|nr:hypothetical protein [Acidobacteriota bacterium]
MNAPLPREGSDRFRSLDAERGVMTSMDGRRAVLLSSSFLFGLTRTLDAESPGVSALTLYAAGTSWGRLYFHDADAWYRRTEGRGVHDVPARTFLATFADEMALAGWGRFTVDFTQKRHGVLVVELTDSPVSGSIGLVGKPVDCLHAGFFAGLLTEFARFPLAAVETSCTSAGDDVCRFVLGAATEVRAPRFWQLEGGSYPDIDRALGLSRVLEAGVR